MGGLAPPSYWTSTTHANTSGNWDAPGGADEARVAAWAEPRRHRLRHGKERAVLRELAALRRRWSSGRGGQREQRLLCRSRGAAEYPSWRAEAGRLADGAVESACRSANVGSSVPASFGV